MKRGTRTALEAAALFAACAVAFHAMLVQQAGVLDIDALYHFKVARLIREHGPWVDISWLPYTVLGERGPDHHWLFHLLVAPLTLLGNDLGALAWASALVAAAMPATLCVLLRAANVPLAPLFALAPMVAAAVLPARFLTLRAQDLALLFMVGALFAAAWRRPVALGIVAFLFTQAYHGAVVLGVIVAAAVAALWLHERQVHLRLVTATAIGVMAGLALSPWFPANVRYLIFHTVFKTTQAHMGLVGTEWLPVTMPHLLLESWPAHAVLLSGLVAAGIAARRGGWRMLAPETLACLLLAAVFAAMYKTGWRFVEYSAPFAIVAAGLLWRDALRVVAWRHAVPALGGALAALVVLGTVVGAQRVGSGLTHRFDAYADMMRYVDAHDDRPIVANSLWSDFQPMMFWSEKARFVAGLDGHYLLYGDLERFKAWNALATQAGADRDDNAATIKRVLGARWVALPAGHARMAEALARDPGARLAMRTADGWLFEIP